ncbi:MAG: hypothetical protein PVI91_04375, partial [Gammaproteobacteria bacterium]
LSALEGIWVARHIKTRNGYIVEHFAPALCRFPSPVLNCQTMLLAGRQWEGLLLTLKYWQPEHLRVRRETGHRSPKA